MNGLGLDPATAAALLPLLVAVPLLTAGALVVAGPRLRLHHTVLMVVLTAALASSVALVAATSGGAALAHGVGQWPVGVAIPFAADLFTALMLTVTGLLTLTCVAFAISSRVANSMYFAPLVLVLVTGINGALLTADLFNLFVFIEVMLLPSYGLFVLSANRREPLRRVDGVRLYVTINLLTSTIFLAGVGFVYGTAGTVNLADLAGAAREDPTVAISAAVCLFALGIKAAVVPVYGWLAQAYPATSPAVTALFSGLHTKVAIYAIYRIYAVLFDGDSRFLWIGVLVFSLTMVIGVLCAVGAKTTRSILAFHMVSQIGYILLGVALFTELGLTAGIFYLLHHMIVKASLFLSTGAIEVRYGTGTIGELSGLAKREPVLAVAFFIAALSLAGIPPFSGFVAKLSLILGAVEAGQVAAVVVMVLVSLVTLLSMLKIWNGMFWGPVRNPMPQANVATTAALRQVSSVSPPAGGHTEVGTSDDSAVTGILPVTFSRQEESDPRPRVSWALTAPALVLALVTVGLGLGAELLLDLSQTAAQGLMDTTTYVEAVSGR